MLRMPGLALHGGFPKAREHLAACPDRSVPGASASTGGQGFATSLITRAFLSVKPPLRI